MVRLYPDDIYFRAFVDAGRSTTKKLSYLLNDVCARSFILMARLGTTGRSLGYGRASTLRLSNHMRMHHYECMPHSAV